MDKNVYVIYGSPCSGKNTFVKNTASENDLVVDIDAIWQSISICQSHEKPQALAGIAFELHKHLLECIKKKIGDWETAYIIGGYPNLAKRKKFCYELNATDIYIDCSKEECIKRLYDNPDGRNIPLWEAYINKWWSEYECGDIVTDIEIFNKLASQFYHSSKWQKARTAYILSRRAIDGGLCEICKMEVGYIVHHKKHLSINNIADPEVTLNPKNFEYVCKTCHDKEPGHWEDRFIQLKKARWQKQYEKSNKLNVLFDNNGQPIMK